MSFIKLNNQEVELDKVQEFVSSLELNRIDIQLESRPIEKVGVGGCQIEDVIYLCKEILCAFNNYAPCRQTDLAITKLQEAIVCCEHRTKETKDDRQARNVEETNEE